MAWDLSADREREQMESLRNAWLEREDRKERMTSITMTYIPTMGWLWENIPRRKMKKRCV